MGRRSTHTPLQLRQLILDAAQEIIVAGGLASLSAREIARRIGYSPGTIYNMYENLDDVVLNVEARVLDALDARLAAVLVETGSPVQVPQLALAYLAFTQENPRLWNLLFEHHLPAGTELPPWYQEKLEGLMGRIETALAPLFPAGQEADPERTAVLAERTRALSEALASITDDQRAAIVLYDVQGYDYLEIAEMTGVSLGTVKSRIHRGRLSLRGILEGRMELFRG